MPAVAMMHTTDPKADLLEKIGDVSDIEVLHNQVLCAIYMAPKQMASGLWRPDNNADEDKYQSKVVLILKTGPSAFVPDEKWSWPADMGVGDWVFLKRSAGWNLTVNSSADNLCVMVDDVDIRGRIPHPDKVW